jgi:molybdopterin-guanine dinucleotide biosynthesis adapter protein
MMIPTQRIFGLAGWSGAGKTTLLERLLPVLTARGLRVATVKHAHHEFELDQPGKDSWRHRQAGACEVMIASSRRWALIHELKGEAEPSLDALLARLSPADLVIVEGFKREPIPKLEVYRAALGKSLLASDDPNIIAIARDAPATGTALPQFDWNDAAGIAEFIVVRFQLSVVSKSSH